MFINKNGLIMNYQGTRSGNPKAMGLYEVSSNTFVATSDTSFQNNKIYYISLGKYLTQIEYGYNKVWGKDTGRNMKAETSGTFLGVVVKLKLSFRRLTQSELEFLVPTLDSAWQKTGYYDPYKKSNQVIDTYTGDWATLNKSSFTQIANANEPFDISVIATKPRK